MKTPPFVADQAIAITKAFDEATASTDARAHALAIIQILGGHLFDMQWTDEQAAEAADRFAKKALDYRKQLIAADVPISRAN